MTIENFTIYDTKSNFNNSKTIECTRFLSLPSIFVELLDFEGLSLQTKLDDARNAEFSNINGFSGKRISHIFNMYSFCSHQTYLKCLFQFCNSGKSISITYFSREFIKWAYITCDQWPIKIP